MTFTAVAAGQLIKASITNANNRHVGRLGETAFKPMDTNGALITDGSQDLGAALNPFGDAYLKAGAKIYRGGVEFESGNNIGFPEFSEIKSWLEKSGYSFPSSNPGAIGESFTKSEDIIITPRVDYSSGTTFIADINKVLLDAMDATTGWTQGTNTPTIATEATIKTEGTNSIKMSKASLNGSIDMYKTFTAFSLIDRLLTVSFYIDTVTNLTRAYIKIESSGSNDKTYYIPVAGLTAATWYHFSIDVSNDTADASTGTLKPGGITKVYFGATTSSSQTINTYWDLLVTASNFKVVSTAKAYKTYIYDASNQELLKLNSIAGTGNTQRNTYTITALSNAYTIATAQARQRNLTISLNQGIFPTGLSGVVAKTVYDIKQYAFQKSLSGSILSMSQRFYDSEYKVSTLSSSTVTKVTSVADRSGSFKSGDKVILFQKVNDGITKVSPYNSTIGLNFKILTLTSDATYSSSEITLTHTGETNSGADISEWYVVRLSAEMIYVVENLTATGSFSTLTPTIFNAFYEKLVGIMFEDTFSRTVTGADNGWTFTADGAGTTPTISSNSYLNLNIGAGNGTAWAARNLEVYDATNLTRKIDILCKCVPATWDSGAFMILYGAVSTNAYLGSGIAIQVDNAGNISIWESTSSVASATWAVIGNSVNFNVRFQVWATGARAKVWLDSASEPEAWNINYEKNAVLTLAGSYLQMNHRDQAGGNNTFQIDSIKITKLETSYSIRGSVSSQSGNCLRAGTKLSRQDTTNQNPAIFQRDLYINGLG